MGQTESNSGGDLAPHAGVPASVIMGRQSLEEYLSKNRVRHDANVSQLGGYRAVDLARISKEIGEYAMRADASRRATQAKLRTDAIEKLRGDAITNGFTTNMLRYLETEIFKTEFSPLFSREILGPCVYNVPEGYRNYTWRRTTSVGEAEAIANDTDDVRSVDMYLEEFNQRFQAYGITYGYSAFDQTAEQVAQMPITIEKGQECVDRIDRRFDSVAKNGDSRFKLSGFFANADVPLLGTTSGYSVPSAGTNWKALIVGSDANRTSFITAFGQMLQQIVEVSGHVEKGPFVVAVDSELWFLIATTPRSSVDGTLLINVLRQMPLLRDLVMWPELSTAGASNASRVIAFTRDPRKVKCLEAVRFKSLAPREKGFAGFSVGNFCVLGGVIIIKTASLVYLDLT